MDGVKRKTKNKNERQNNVFMDHLNWLFIHQVNHKEKSAFLIMANVSFAIPSLVDGSPAALQHLQESLQ